VTRGTNYNVAGNSATAAFNLPGLDSNMLAIAVDTNHHLLFGVLDNNSTTVANHSLKAYDISTPSSPVVISNFTYLATTTGSSSNNPNFAGAVDTDNDRIISLDTQNGVIALRIVQTYPPGIATQPSSQTNTVGAVATFAVSATGTLQLGYQWRFNNANIPSATDSSYMRSNLQPGDAGSYSVIVTNSAGSATSSEAVLTVNSAPTITTQPQSLIVTQGNNATFTVEASGAPAPEFQWRFNGTNISGANNSAFQIFAAQGTNSGNYTVMVSNSVNTITSWNAHLTVVTMPVHFESTALTNGGKFYFRGTGDPGTYQILVSTNLVDWSTATTILNTNGIFEWTDSEVVPFQRYYRARLVP
jgi:hypothetical protein